MWQKDDYQEQMLGYLGTVQTEIEQLTRFRFRRRDLNELYTDLDITLEQLWRLIRASDLDWETFRFPLESSCDELLHAVSRLPRNDAFSFSAEAAFDASPADLTSGVEIRTNPDDRLYNYGYPESHVLDDFTRSLDRKELA